MICDCNTTMVKKGTRNGNQRYRCPSCEKWKDVPIPIPGNVLVVGDTHVPYEHPRYLDFVCRVRDKYRCDTVIHMGDLIDNNSINYHEKDPDGHSPGREFELTYTRLKTWVVRIPKMHICIGNHDELIFRKAMTIGLPRKVIRSINEIFELPDTWKWADSWMMGGVCYKHGTGKSGKYMHLNWAQENMMSTVTGHGHSNAGVGFFVSPTSIAFGMGVGCGIDINSFAMAYGKHFGRRPVLGCGVITENGKIPHFIPMEMH